MVAASQSKRREKYARREDAIADAIELEKEMEKVAAAPAGKKSKLKGKQNGEQTKKGGKSSKKGGQAMKAPQAGGAAESTRDASDAEAPPALPPRMRGLQDLVSAGTSSKVSSIEGLDAGSSEASLLDEREPGKAMKRKRSGGRGEEAPSKRRDKKRPIAQVLETSSQRENGELREEGGENEKVKPEVCDGDEKLSDVCESTQETVVNPVVSGDKDSQALDAHSASYNGKDSALAPGDEGGAGALPPLASSPSALLQEKPQVKKEKVVNKRKKTPPAPRTLASLIDTGAVEEKLEPDEQQQQATGGEQRSNVSRQEPSSISKPEETLTACSPSPKSEEQKEPPKEGFKGLCHPRTRFEKQPVPVIPLYSSLIQNSVHGYPVTVEVVKSIGPLWQTSKRSSRYRATRFDFLPAYEEDCGVKIPGSGKAPKKSKEALSKKLLKRAVLTSKKIRTLASISEERGRQPLAELLSSEVPPRWPVATLVPVSVALNRLRTIVCS